MIATTAEIDGRFAIEAPGIASLQVEYHLDENGPRVTIRCPACRLRTVRHIVSGDTFEIAHRRSCRLEKAIVQFMRDRPELVGTAYTVVGFEPGASWMPSAPSVSDS